MAHQKVLTIAIWRLCVQVILPYEKKKKYVMCAPWCPNQELECEQQISQYTIFIYNQANVKFIMFLYHLGDKWDQRSEDDEPLVKLLSPPAFCKNMIGTQLILWGALPEPGSSIATFSGFW